MTLQVFYSYVWATLSYLVFDEDHAFFIGEVTWLGVAVSFKGLGNCSGKMFYYDCVRLHFGFWSDYKDLKVGVTILRNCKLSVFYSLCKTNSLTGGIWRVAKNLDLYTILDEEGFSIWEGELEDITSDLEISTFIGTLVTLQGLIAKLILVEDTLSSYRSTDSTEG